jgi:GTP cyclohydrolase I
MSKKEGQKEAEDAIRTLLKYVGEDIEREGLKNTPARVVRAFEEYTKGYKENPKDHLSVTFEDIYDEIIAVSDIPFTSLCEHHLAGIAGVVHVHYQPNGKIVGLSKIARLVDIYATRLQLQERLTREIARCFYEIVAPKAVKVEIIARHDCMAVRGVKKSGTLVKTAYQCGVFESGVPRVD